MATTTEPAWLTAAADQRIALMADILGEPGKTGLKTYGMVMTTLTEPEEGASPEQMKRWEFTCDNCNRYCPTTMVSSHVRRDIGGTPVSVVFGACPRCLEGAVYDDAV